jgi:hypothetical protein
MVKFVNSKAGTWRTPEGTLLPEAGLIEEMHEPMRSFLADLSSSAPVEQAKTVANTMVSCA